MPGDRQACARVLHDWSDGAEFDLVPAMATLSLVSIGEALFQVDLSDQVELYGRALQIHSETLRDEFRCCIRAARLDPDSGQAAKTLGSPLFTRPHSWDDPRKAGHRRHRDEVLAILRSAVDEPRNESRITEQQAIDEATILFVAGQDDITAP